MDVVDIPDAPAVEKFASRDDWFSAAGKLKEEFLHVEGIGKLLVSEVSGEVRADIMSDQSAALLSDGPNKKLDQKSYHKKLLLAGVVDPESPTEGRLPFFKPGDVDRAMKVGGAKVAKVIDKIEQLSNLGQYAGAAEKNSETAASDAGTSA